MAGSSPRGAAAAGDASSVVRRSPPPDDPLDVPSDAASSPVGDSYAPPVLQASSLGASDLLESGQAASSAALQRPDDPSQDVREGGSWKGSRRSPYTAEAPVTGTAQAPTVVVPISVSGVRDRGSPQSKLQRRPIHHPPPNSAWYASHALSTSQSRSLVPFPVSQQYARQPSQRSREENRICHLPSAKGQEVLAGPGVLIRQRHRQRSRVFGSLCGHLGRRGWYHPSLHPDVWDVCLGHGLRGSVLNFASTSL